MVFRGGLERCLGLEDAMRVGPSIQWSLQERDISEHLPTSAMRIQEWLAVCKAEKKALPEPKPWHKLHLGLSSYQKD